jgi:hypothetical protein
MSELVLVFGVIVATFGTLIGLLVVFRKWMLLRERIERETASEAEPPAHAAAVSKAHAARRDMAA